MSAAAVSSLSLSSRTSWRDLVLPREHGSWSLALEPLALGLLVVPSVTGGWLALAVVAGFLARRPLKLVVKEREPARRAAAERALAALASVGGVAFAGAVVTGGAGWLGWLLPFAIAGAAFLAFDLRNGGREEAVEIVGAAAFASVTAAVVAAGGAGEATAAALAVAMAARAVPAVMFVRACVRGGKTGAYRPAPALLAGGLGVLATAALAFRGLAPVLVPLALAVLFMRAALRLLQPTPIRARTLGLQELVIGVAYIAIVVTAWRG